MNATPAELPSVFHPEPKLAAVPTQPSAKNRETLPALAPRTWTFIARPSGQLETVTCLPGCVVPHDRDRETPTFRDDIWCMTDDVEDLWLPVSTGGQKPEEDRLLSCTIRQDPFDKDMAKRVPHAVLEIMEDSFIQPLDPDGLATVILKLEGQLQQIRKVHAQLTALREQGRVEL
ncbi:hypothetical protein ABZ891_12610 [Streptomyces sp. NPDC047023]|uniref:DUF6907 domain-containing protein n=1 Tax=Streptomyces sp. NPDC047023 TaxID=3155139 RepID=UPI0033D5F491